MSLLLTHATDVDGRAVDVRVDGATVAAVAPAGTLTPTPGEQVHDLTGHLLLPAPAEPHAHLDKALTSHRAPNRTGDLAGAIVAIREIAAGFTHEDLVERATRAAMEYLSHGTTAIRTHADLGAHTGTRHVRALLQVRDALAGLIDVQVVALTSGPWTPEDVRDNARLLEEAVDLGVDLVGGAPHMWADRAAGLDLSWDAAVRHGLPLDLHTDETLDPTAQGLLHLAQRVLGTGFDRAVTASHCVSLGVHPLAVARATAAEVARAGVGVVALPQTNLFLQARGELVGPPRGLTAVRTLLEAGATLGAGGDNLRDPFNPMGRADACEAASLLVAAGHLSSREAWDAVSTGARRCMGLPVPAVAAGAPAEFLAVAAEGLDAAVAGAGTRRLVVSRGRLVARTEVVRTVEWPRPPAETTS
ncbi:amidohydrolase family protein [Modestobacter sp. I12A-02628]|uniref:Amidohydrolase family protein n=1 Tax=Goekera deserti TaxID=2497753 RepID=A0A7K3WC84_9ACTN|nr:amidohydrolase family protein [Goekera deserti]MPQ98350.1 amidohydrolase family protein [Goekera deserti]NDI48177.1 amidohydrolase family protein [Goekera deserti]NEL53926.1 amidohydrolase family protein [Goekera deserti]